MADYDIAAAFAAIEQELISSMIRNMDRHRAEEILECKEWTMWQAEQLRALERYRVQNQKKYKGRFSSINGKIGDMIRASRQKGNMKQETRILQAIRKGYKVWGKNKSPANQAMTAKFFQLNDRKLEALIEATTHDMQKAENAILRMADDQYRKAIFNAQMYANSGAGTYAKAVDMATKDMLSAGLNCVEYANGARHTLSDYADMAVRTACKRAYLTGEGEKRKEWGVSTVIMNKRGNPCPKCLPFVGKILIDDVWSGGKADNGSYHLMSGAVAAGLYHPRCRDSHTTYFEGISTPPDDKFTRQEIADIEAENKKEQKQQYAKRQADKFRRLEQNSLDAENQEKYGRKAQEWENRTGCGAESAFVYENHPVYFDENNDYSVILPDYSDEVNRGLSEAMEDVARKGGADGCEHMHLVNLRTGELAYYETNGEGASVGVNFWKYAEEHLDENFAFVHNHNITSSLSASDLITPVIYRNVPVQVAVQNDGVKYIAKRTKDADPNFYPDFYYESELEDLNKMSRNGNITPTERLMTREKIIVESLLKDFYEEGEMVIGRRAKK